MTAGSPQDQRVGNKMITDLIAIERSRAENAIKRGEELSQVLNDLAMRMNGVALERQRRKDPTIPDNWTPEEWRAFFGGLRIHAENGKGAWGQSEVEVIDREDHRAAGGELGHAGG